MKTHIPILVLGGVSIAAIVGVILGADLNDVALASASGLAGALLPRSSGQ